jgi:hypothetical protein
MSSFLWGFPWSDWRIDTRTGILMVVLSVVAYCWGRIDQIVAERKKGWENEAHRSAQS